MKIEQLSAAEAVQYGQTLPYALVRSLSQVSLGPAPATVDLDELLDARFFNDTEEIRIFQGEDGLQGARLTAEADDILLPETRKVMNPIFGAEITLCREVKFDEDGQAYLSAARLTGWRGGTAHGSRTL